MTDPAEALDGFLLSRCRKRLAEATELLDEAEVYISDGIVDVPVAEALLARIVAFDRSGEEAT